MGEVNATALACAPHTSLCDPHKNGASSGLLFPALFDSEWGYAGELLPAFLLGSVATVVSTLLALTIFPLASLGENGWKIAAVGTYFFDL